VLVIPSINDRLVAACLERIGPERGTLLARRGMDRDLLTRLAAADWEVRETGGFHYARADCENIPNEFTEAFILCRDAGGSLSLYDNAAAIAVGRSRRITFLDPQGTRRSFTRFGLGARLVLRLTRGFLRQAAIFGLIAVTALPLAFAAPWLRMRTAARARRNTLRVLLAKRVHSNQSALLTRGLRDLGVQADSLSLSGHPFDYEPCDREENLDRLSDRSRLIRLAAHYFRSMAVYDAFVYQNNYETFWVSPTWGGWNLPYSAQWLEAAISRLLGKKIIYIFRDCSLRRHETQAAREPLVYCRECAPTYEGRFCGSSEVRRRANLAIRSADKILVSTPDLLIDTPPSATWLPNAIRCAEESPGTTVRSRASGESIVILHASTDALLKRTAALQRVADRLAARYRIELKVLSKTSHKEMIEAIENCDIAVDQFSLGAYGNFAIECMAAGKPVVGWVIKDLYPKAVPIHSPEISDLENDLEHILASLIENADLRRSSGEEGRKYVREVHAVEKVSARMRAAIEEP
jgi:hypothetical protein